MFPTWKVDAGIEGVETPEEIQRKDSLGTQIWKLYSSTKMRLPNQERMENLTWRMMAMNLKRRQREQAPSGIAQQLQNSVDQGTLDSQSDGLDLDDFIVPSSVASLAGLAAEAPTENLNNHSHAQTAGIPIATKNKPRQRPSVPLPAASMPKTIQNKGRTGEFDYVQRRVRKMSIDERSVSFYKRTSRTRTFVNICVRIVSDELNSLLRFLLQTTSTTLQTITLIRCQLRISNTILTLMDSSLLA